MPPRPKPNAAHDAPGSLGNLDFLDDVTTKPAKAEAQPPSTDDLASSKSENADSDIPIKGKSAKAAPSRASKHHVSLYVSPSVDRAMKRIALDDKKPSKAWETYHQAIREYLDRHGLSFDDLMRQG